MTLLLHGEAGGWDELVIAAVAFGVLWIAVKLAGRKPAADDEAEPAPDAVSVEADRKDPLPPPAPKLS